MAAAARVPSLLAYYYTLFGEWSKVFHFFPVLSHAFRTFAPYIYWGLGFRDRGLGFVVCIHCLMLSCFDCESRPSPKGV